jgi:hypothetical protein
LVLTSSLTIAKPNTLNLGVRSQVVDVPVRPGGPLLMVGNPGTQATRPQRAAQMNVISALKLGRSHAPHLNTGIARTGKYQRIRSGFRLNDNSHRCPILDWQHLAPTLLKYTARNIDNHMADWKVIALVSGNIEAVSGPAAQDRPGAHEWTVWEGLAANKAEALKCAEKADPRVDLEWMRIRAPNAGVKPK